MRCASPETLADDGRPADPSTCPPVMYDEEDRRVVASTRGERREGVSPPKAAETETAEGDAGGGGLR